MATQLTRQLAALQADTAVARAGGPASLKARASFLFTPREAAGLDSAAVFAIGANGFAELCALDAPAFAPFADDLFSEAWASLDRECASADVNAALNARVAAFGVAASPHFPLRAVHKCLEWLIRGFSAHVYNIDGVCRASWRPLGEGMKWEGRGGGASTCAAGRRGDDARCPQRPPSHPPTRGEWR